MNQPTHAATQFFTFDNLNLDSGARLSPVTVAYETWGTLNSERTNAILICHALSGDAHAAQHDEQDTEGWWNDYIGTGKAFDTDLYFVICSNIIGGCSGSTGPGSLNVDGKPYALSFPLLTIGDMVEAQSRLVDFLGIAQLYAVAGGSMGGMQALEWSTRFPRRMRKIVCSATTSHHSPQQIAWNEVGRQAIMTDPDWNGGDWYDEVPPAAGLSIARMIGHITYLSEESLEKRFARHLQDKSAFSFNFDAEFQIESYLRYQGQKFVSRFDANSYLYITRALDYFDMAAPFGSLQAAFATTQAQFLFASFTSDWLYAPRRVRELYKTALLAGHNALYQEIDEPHGHDSFLLPSEPHETAIRTFLGNE